MPKAFAHGPRSRPPRAALLSIVADLRGDEIEVLLVIASRMLHGRRLYGELRIAEDHRDFAREALEEVADAAVYAAAGLIAGEARAGAVNSRSRVINLEPGDDAEAIMTAITGACRRLHALTESRP